MTTVPSKDAVKKVPPKFKTLGRPTAAQKTASSNKTWKAFEHSMNTDSVYQKLKEKIVEMATQGPKGEAEGPVVVSSPEASKEKKPTKPAPYNRSNSSG